MFYKKKLAVGFDWENIITGLPISVYWKDKHGRYLGCNLQYAEYVGVSSIEEIIGKLESDLPWEKRKARELMELDKSVMNLKKAIIIEKLECYSVKMPLKNRDGIVVGIFGFLLDIEKHKGEITRELRLLDEIIAMMPGHVYWKDRNCVLQGCNDLQAKDSGLSSRKMIVGKTAYDLLLQDQSEEEKQHQAAITNSYDEEVMKCDKTMTFEEHVVLSDKSIATFLSQKTPLHDEYGNVAGLVGISFDITDRKKTEEFLKFAKEQAEAANRSKIEFLENMRHDIRTPLTGIIGFAQLIQKEASNPLVKEYADNLVMATTALLDFQNEILDAIKVSQGDIPVLQQNFSLKEITKKVLDLVRPKAILKKLPLYFYYDEQLPEFFYGDSKRLFRILLELMTNALKFTAKGHIHLKLSFSEKNGALMTLRCEVIDTGIGIPDDKKEDIFIRFQRLSPSSDGIYEGTGLGLTTVKQFIEELGGKISVDSVINQGTTFACFIPLHSATETTENEKINTPEIPRHYKTCHVLLVEDHVMTATVTKLMLLELDCIVDVAANAKLALMNTQKETYDLILMDLGLPDCNGFALTQKIRSQYAKINQKPIIIALTAHKEEESEKLCLTSGMDAIFQKPLLKSTAINLLNFYFSDNTMKTPIIDLPLGAKRVNQDEAAAKSMLQLLLRHIDEDQHHIQTAFHKNDWARLRDVTHKLLGGLAYCGAPRLELAGVELQNALKIGNKSDIAICTQRLLTEIQRLKTHSASVV
ncbi:MAG: hypothetical protein A3F13_08360 [Gammaproteobacteria bacterium RIFCSPHIGHO2_12_FULL_40_19]|nr:MAG: hypothetical protein A3F13_08360 [Gammaproteobacteria bacterium RIFCSPHIGHO2_12_FULL_40_19]